MSYDMAFKGVFTYKDSKAAKQALAEALNHECRDDCVVGETEMALDGKQLKIECFISAPASMWETTCEVIEAIAATAIAGRCNAQYDSGEGEESIYRLRYLAGGEEEEIDGPFDDDMTPSAR